MDRTHQQLDTYFSPNQQIPLGSNQEVDFDEDFDEEETLNAIASLEMNEKDLVQRLEDVDVIWQRKRSDLVEQIERVRADKLPFQKALGVAERRRSTLTYIGNSSLTWVESHWFCNMCLAVVATNITLMLCPSMVPAQFHALLDNVFLSWYVLEMSLGLYHYSWAFFVGAPSRVVFNWLDAAIVLSGIVDQWLMPFIVPHHGGHGANEVNNARYLRIFRILRLFRLLRLIKLAKTFFFSDMAWLLDTHEFEVVMSCVIGLNSIVMAFELDVPWQGWATVDNIFLVVYFTELSLKLKTRSWRFFIDNDWAWNWLDFTIVASGVLDSWLKPLMHLFQKETSEYHSHANPVTSVLRLFRILRVLRLVRLLRAVPALHLLLRGIMAALDAMKWVIVITILMLYGGSIVFTYVVGRGLIYGSEADVPHEALEKFGSVTDSLFSLFELMNGDVTVVDSIIKNVGGKLLFVAFMVISNWAILAILTSVVSDNMISASAQIAEEHKQLEIEKDKQRSDRRLLRVFGLIDINGNGYITEDEWQDLMGNTDLQTELIDASGMDESDLHDLFECMVEHQMQKKVKNPRIDYGTFVTYIDDQHSVADKRTVMQINLRMRNLEQKMDRTLDRLNNGFIDPQTHLGVKRQKSGQVVNL